MNPRVFLKEGREKSLKQRHPWVFSGAVARVEGSAADGGTVDICAADGAFLATACWNSQSQIVARVWSWTAEPIDRAFFTRRIAESAARRNGAGTGTAAEPVPAPLTELRSSLGGRPSDPSDASDPSDMSDKRIPPTSAFRVVNGEADLLPGLIVDRYAEFLSIQVLTLAMAKRLPEIVEILVELFQPRGIWQRSDVEVRRKEGLELETGRLYGEEPPPLLEIRENGVRLLVDLRGGQKTGFFLDQRDNRRIVGEFLRDFRFSNDDFRFEVQKAGVIDDIISFENRKSKIENPGQGSLELLNAFSYSAGFGVYASQAVPECRVTNLDASAGALALAKANAELNGVPDGRWSYLEGDAFKVLRTFRDSRRTFDAIVLDPPKFAQSKSQVEGACRGYKDLNLLAIKLLKPGGLLFTFSCSGGVSPELFQKVVAGAAADAGREAQVLAHLGPGSDHPVLLSFPEGEYLKGLVIRCL